MGVLYGYSSPSKVSYLVVQLCTLLRHVGFHLQLNLYEMILQYNLTLHPSSDGRTFEVPRLRGGTVNHHQ
jgi:hypothetical protein